MGGRAEKPGSPEEQAAGRQRKQQRRAGRAGGTRSVPAQLDHGNSPRSKRIARDGERQMHQGRGSRGSGARKS